MANKWTPSMMAGTVGSAMVSLVAAGSPPQFWSSYLPVHQAYGQPYELAGTMGAPTQNAVSIYQGVTASPEPTLAEHAAEAFGLVARAQVALEPDFARVLSQRIWDLYEE